MAVLGLLDGKQAFFAMKMSQLVTGDAPLSIDSQSSHEDDDAENLDDKAEKTEKSVFRDRIAAKLLKSKDEVDLRMMRLHGFFKSPPSSTTNLLSYLGVMTHLNRRFSQKIVDPPSSLFAL